MHDQTTSQDQFIDLDDLVCGDCRDLVADGPDGFTHDDGTQLCTPEPVEVTP